MLITCGLYEKHYKSKFSSETISSLNSLVNSLSVNKTYPFGNAKPNALSRVSTSRWGVIKPGP